MGVRQAHEKLVKILVTWYSEVMPKRPIKPTILKKASTVLGLKTFAAISAVEGLKLSASGRKRVMAPLSTDRRREEIVRAYLDLKRSR
jgi:hypothetical protein